eukprot:GHVU01093394.1.p1 GENE.GHVU01093394.1~~GHVU01093394.1.p1  ORF type:complete len:102 (-),score=3.32 GHVU01093394.1:44-349(-)
MGIGGGEQPTDRLPCQADPMMISFHSFIPSKFFTLRPHSSYFSFIHSFIPPFVHSFIPPFVQSFIPPFIPSVPECECSVVDSLLYESASATNPGTALPADR